VVGVLYCRGEWGGVRWVSCGDGKMIAYISLLLFCCSAAAKQEMEFLGMGLEISRFLSW
jgi:hypothetical protein